MDGWKYGCKGRLVHPWLWKHVGEVFRGYDIKNLGLAMRKWVSNCPNWMQSPFTFVGVVFLWGRQLVLSAHLSGLSSPTQPPAVISHSHTDISLRLISCYFFMGASGLTMQRAFSHRIERNFSLCAGMSATVRSCSVSVRPPAMMAFPSPPPTPSPLSPWELFTPSGGDFSRCSPVSKLLSLQAA